MADSDVYGGSGWYQMALQAAAEAAARALQQWQLMGYQTQPAVKPTREQALTAIWQMVPDAKKEKGNPIQAAERWLSKNKINDDPIQWAINQGFIQGPTAEQRIPTLEREQWQESLKQWEKQFGEQTQQGREQLGLNYMQLLSSLRGPGDWLNYWNVARAGQNSELPMWATQLAQGRGLPSFQGTPGNVDPANVWLRPNQPGMANPTQAYQLGTAAAQYPVYYNQQNGQWQWTAQNPALGPVPNSAAMPGGQQAPYVPGYSGQQSPWTPWQVPNVMYNQSMQTPAQGQGYYWPTQQYQQGQQTPQYGRGYVAPNFQSYNLGGGAQAASGPEQQNAMLQQMTNTIMQQVMNGMPGTINNLPYDASGLVNQPDMPATWRPALPTYQPHRITPQMWNNLTPSEQEGFIGMIEGQGQWGPDFLQMMQRAWPRGTAKPRTFWS